MRLIDYAHGNREARRLVRRLSYSSLPLLVLTFAQLKMNSAKQTAYFAECLEWRWLASTLLRQTDLCLLFTQVLPLIRIYSLRFQIEFNFRDAKQHFGLEDFMNTSKRGVENASNLALMMVNVSAKLLKDSAANCVGIEDLKTHFRGVKYALEAIKILQEKAIPSSFLRKSEIKPTEQTVDTQAIGQKAKVRREVKNRTGKPRSLFNYIRFVCRIYQTRIISAVACRRQPSKMRKVLSDKTVKKCLGCGQIAGQSG